MSSPNRPQRLRGFLVAPIWAWTNTRRGTPNTPRHRRRGTPNSSKRDLRPKKSSTTCSQLLKPNNQRSRYKFHLCTQIKDQRRICCKQFEKSLFPKAFKTNKKSQKKSALSFSFFLYSADETQLEQCWFIKVGMTSAWAAQHHSPSWSLHKLGSADYPCDFFGECPFSTGDPRDVDLA